LIVVPSGTTPCVTNRHRAISSLRANATIITFRTRLPVAPARLRYQCTRAEPGWTATLPAITGALPLYQQRTSARRSSALSLCANTGREQVQQGA
jgi:hypothetical protein